MIELGVIEAVEKMNGAGPRRREADARLAGELGVGARHESGHLLVPHLHVVDLVGERGERDVDAVDPVAGVPVNPLHAPLHEPLDEKVTDGIAHTQSR